MVVECSKRRVTTRQFDDRTTIDDRRPACAYPSHASSSVAIARSAEPRATPSSIAVEEEKENSIDDRVVDGVRVRA